MVVLLQYSKMVKEYVENNGEDSYVESLSKLECSEQKCHGRA